MIRWMVTSEMTGIAFAQPERFDSSRAPYGYTQTTDWEFVGWQGSTGGIFGGPVVLWRAEFSLDECQSHHKDAGLEEK